MRAEYLRQTPMIIIAVIWMNNCLHVPKKYRNSQCKLALLRSEAFLLVLDYYCLAAAAAAVHMGQSPQFTYILSELLCLPIVRRIHTSHKPSHMLPSRR